MSRFPWLHMRKKAAPEVVERPPIRLGAFSNGEYFHEQTALERKIEREILTQAGEKARRLGMDRREFLASAMGMATSLSVLNLAASCGSERSGTRSEVDGGYHIPPEATMDCELAEAIVNGQNEFIFDIQTHHIDNEGSWRTTNPTSGATLATLFSKFNGCTDAELTRCIDADTYLQQVFLESDTTLAVLSGLSAPLCTQERTMRCGAPLDNDALAKSVERINMLARSQRVINHCQVNPTDQLDLQLAMMERIKAQYGVGGWKTYPEWGPGGKGWAMTDAGSGSP